MQQGDLTLGVPVDQATASQLIGDSGVMYVAVPAESSEGVSTLKRFLGEGVKELLIRALQSYYSGSCVNSDNWRPTNDSFNRIRISLAGLRLSPEEACKILAITVYDFCISKCTVKGAPSLKLRGDILLAVLDSESCGGYLVRSHNLIGWEGFLRFALILGRRINVSFGNYLRITLNGDQKYTKARDQALEFYNMPMEVLENTSKSQLAQDMAKHCMDIASRIERACAQLLVRDRASFLEHVTALSSMMSQLTISALCLSAAAHTATLSTEYVRLLSTGKVEAQVTAALRRALDAHWDGTAAGAIPTLHKVVKERKDLECMDCMESYYDKYGQYLKKITKEKVLKHALQRGKDMVKTRRVGTFQRVASNTGAVAIAITGVGEDSMGSSTASSNSSSSSALNVAMSAVQLQTSQSPNTHNIGSDAFTSPTAVPEVLSPSSSSATRYF